MCAVVSTANAAGTVEICPPKDALKPLIYDPIAGNDVLIDADQGQGAGQSNYEMNGHVELRRQNQLLQTDHLYYDQPADHLRASGSVRFQQPGLVLRGSEASLEQGGKKGDVKDAAYFLSDHGARGDAADLSFVGSLVELKQASYSTCAEPEKSWMLRAQSLVLDGEANEGIARNVTLRVADVPILYLPYASFPLKGRKSGLLPPDLDNSNINGLDVRIPYYLNLAPDRDATLTPRIISKRGVQLGGQLRYLNPRNHGELAGEYLPNDALTDRSRSLATYNHMQNFGTRGTAEIQLQQASDPDYFHDLGNSLTLASQSQLDRHLQGRWATQNWTASAMVQDFQVLDRQLAKPYRRLPQLAWDGALGSDLAQFFWHSEYTYFDRPTGPTGHRVLLEPGLKTLKGGDAYFFSPQLRLRQVNYRLSDTGLASSTYNASHAALTVDSGLFFEREGDNYVQTLEPRLTYIYAPSSNQTRQPLFDTGVVEFDLAQLFRDSRYSGGDRFGDDHHLTSSLTQRWTDVTNGHENLRLTLAQAYYLSDQQASIPGEQAAKQNEVRSAAEIAARLHAQVTARASAYAGTDSSRPAKGAFQVHYAGTQNALDLSYRFRRDATEHTAVTGLWHVNAHWRVAGRWLYSLRDDRTQEAIIGLEYDACCWGLRLAARRYLDGNGTTYTNGIGVQVELKGLSSFGTHLSEKFTQEFLGFAPEG